MKIQLSMRDFQQSKLTKSLLIWDQSRSREKKVGGCVSRAECKRESGAHFPIMPRSLLIWPRPVEIFSRVEPAPPHSSSCPSSRALTDHGGPQPGYTWAIQVPQWATWVSTTEELQTESWGPETEGEQWSSPAGIDSSPQQGRNMDFYFYLFFILFF
jgi:hypothetical protein